MAEKDGQLAEKDKALIGYAKALYGMGKSYEEIAESTTLPIELLKEIL